MRASDVAQTLKSNVALLRHTRRHQICWVMPLPFFTSRILRIPTDALLLPLIFVWVFMSAVGTKR